MAKDRASTLRKLEAQYRRDRAKIQNNTQISESYRVQLLREAHRSYLDERAAEEERIRSEIENESRRAYKTVNKREAAAGSAERELHLANVREELLSELRGGSNPIRLYEEAARVDDDARLRLLSLLGPGFLDSTQDKLRFGQMVRAREPADVQRARKTLEENGKETFVFDVASSIRKGLNSRREQRLAKSPPSTSGYDWNTTIRPLPEE
jgi:hypothetical protein